MTKAKPNAKVPPHTSHEDATVLMFRDDPDLAAVYLNQVLADGERQVLLLAMRYLATAFGGVSGVGRVLAFAVDPLVLTEPAAVAARALTCDASPSTAKPLRATQQVRR